MFLCRRYASSSQFHALCSTDGFQVLRRCCRLPNLELPPPTHWRYIKYSASSSYATSMTHNYGSLLHSQRSFVIRAYILFPNRHGGDGQRAHACMWPCGLVANGFEESSQVAPLFGVWLQKASKAGPWFLRAAPGRK